jgi:hypothetical protein
MMDEDFKTLKAGECHEFDCSVCSRRFVVAFEPDYANMLTAQRPESAEVGYCPFCGEPALCFDD